MFKSKRGSTLLLALLLFAFVIIIGTGTVMLTSVSSEQTTDTLGSQQAEFSARSVLDAVISEIRAGEIDPQDTQTTGVSITGSGADDILGTYQFTIEPFMQGTTQELYKVTADSDYKGYTATVSSILQRFSEEDQPGVDSPFEVLSLATGSSTNGNHVNNSHLEGSMRIDNHGEKLLVSAGGYVTGDLEVIGDLEIGGGAYVGTQGDDNIIKVTGDFKLGGGGRAYADVWCLGDVSVSGGASLDGDLYADGDITISSGGSVVEGSIYSSDPDSVITLSGGTRVNGDIITNGSVVITNSSPVVTGKIIAGGDVDISAQVYQGITANGSVYIYNAAVTGDVTAGGDIAVGKNKAGQSNPAVVNGNLLSNGFVTEYGSSQVNGQVQSVGDVLLDKNALQTGNIFTNGNVNVQDSSVFHGDVEALGSFTITENKNATCYGNVRAGVNASIDKGILNGNLWARGNGYFPGKKDAKTVTGIIYLGGTLLGGSSQGNTVQLVDPASIQLQQPIVPVVPLGTPPVEQVEFVIDTGAAEWVILSDIMAEMAEVQVDFDLTQSSGANYTVEGNNYIINQNCTLKSITFDAGWKNKNIVFDATEQDLYIMLATPENNGSTITFNTTDVLTKGDHNVFLLLDVGEGGNHVNLRVQQGHVFSYIDYEYSVPANDPRYPNLFIISNSTAPGSFIDFAGGSSLYGFIYAPYYDVAIKQYSMFSYKLYGSVVAASVDFDFPNYIYRSPDLTDSVGGPSYQDPGEEETVSWARLGTYFGDGEG